MNVFVLDDCPKKAAKMQCDKHIVKMPLESAQMLSTAHRLLDGKVVSRMSNSGKRTLKHWQLSDSREDILYKAAHVKHPCTIWTTESSANYRWHYEHFIALCEEYTYRYGKVHKSQEQLAEVLKVAPKNIRGYEMTPFKLAMGSNPECMLDSVIDSYKAYYRSKAKNFVMKWTKRPTPTWFYETTITS